MGGGPTSRGGSPMWSSFYNPWTVIITMRLSPTMGASSPRPPPPAIGSTSYALLWCPTAFGTPSTILVVGFASPPSAGTPASTPWSPLAGGWDQASLAASFRTMALTLPPPL